MKMRTKAWSLGLSSQRREINQLSPLPPETYLFSSLTKICKMYLLGKETQISVSFT